MFGFKIMHPVWMCVGLLLFGCMMNVVFGVGAYGVAFYSIVLLVMVKYSSLFDASVERYAGEQKSETATSVRKVSEGEYAQVEYSDEFYGPVHEGLFFKASEITVSGGLYRWMSVGREWSVQSDNKNDAFDLAKKEFHRLLITGVYRNMLNEKQNQILDLELLGR